MNYTVIWLTAAEASLAAVWVTHTDRAAVARAAHDLDRVLAAGGPTVGESRPGSRRITFEPPLGALFRVVDRTVRVIRVWSIG